VDQIELLAARGLAEFERVQGFRAAGAADAVAWLGIECKLAPESAADRVTLARQLPGLDRTAELLATGRISFEQASVVARTTARVRADDAREVEERILDAAPC